MLTQEKEKKIRKLVKASAVSPEEGNFCSVLLWEIDRLRDTLSFYANEANYFHARSLIEQDYGKQSRNVLKRSP